MVKNNQRKLALYEPTLKIYELLINGIKNKILDS